MKAKQNLPGTRKKAAQRATKRTLGPAATAAILGSPRAPGADAKLSHIPPKWKKYYRRLLQLRARLEEERSGLTSTASQPLENYSMDMADAATDEFEHNVALCGLSADQDALFEIDEALKRIDHGTYGICQLSGKPISAARLEALPWTRFAGEAERQLEQEGAVHRARLGELRSVTGPPSGNLEESQPGEEPLMLAPSDETLSRVVPVAETVLGSRRRPEPARKSPPARRARKPRGRR